MEDGAIEVYEGSWDVGKFHGDGTLTIAAPNGSYCVTEGRWEYGEFVAGEARPT